MRTALHRFEDTVLRLLPRATAQAACTDSFYEYRCACCGTCGSGNRQQRVCRYCNGTKSCSGWLCTSTRCAKTCPC
jgi:hypothetical protein